MCVFVPVSTATWQGTQPHTTRFTACVFRLKILKSCIILILYIIWSRVGGILSLVACGVSDRGVAAAAVAMSIEHRDFHW